MSLTSLVLRLAAPVPHPESFSRYLFVGPHPDDIEIGAGATVAKLSSMGKEICFLICTDGRFGTAHAPQGTGEDGLAQLRREEALRSAKHLGVNDVRFLDLRDGNGYTMESLLRGIAKTVADFQPDIIFGPDPFVASESHQDHLNTGCAVRQIACFAPYSGIMAAYDAPPCPVKALAYYMTAKPNRYVATHGFFSRQTEAISCHASQYPEDSEDFRSLITYLKLRRTDFGLRSLHRGAEGFRVLGALHMHCIPEVH